MNLILAVDENWGIGKDNEMLFHLKKDLAHFKKTTLGKTVIMGRKTYESIGQALPDRENIVLSRDQSFDPTDALVFRNVDDVLDYTMDMRDDVFVIGGQEIVDIFLGTIDIAIITKIFASKEADTFLHNFDDDSDFEITDQSEIYEENGVHFQIIRYERIRNGRY